MMTVAFTTLLFSFACSAPTPIEPDICPSQDYSIKNPIEPEPVHYIIELEDGTRCTGVIEDVVDWQDAACQCERGE